MSRRVSKTGHEWASNGWQEVSVSAFLYDGWLLVSEESASCGNITTNFYVWGLDLSGSLQGAGGVGGLLAARLGTNNVVCLYDGNGNVSELTDASTGGVKAHYEYSPFGETLVSEGALAKDNPFRFSTKYTDDETAFVYYGYRYYAPGMGRWLSRDPLGEVGGLYKRSGGQKLVAEYLRILNNYLMVKNTPVFFVDWLGLNPYPHYFEMEGKLFSAWCFCAPPNNPDYQLTGAISGSIDGEIQYYEDGQVDFVGSCSCDCAYKHRCDASKDMTASGRCIIGGPSMGPI